MTPSNEKCGDTSCTGGLVFECFGKADCPAGTVCCLTDKTARCSTKCGGTYSGQIVCTNQDDCFGAFCEESSCGANAAFKLCASSVMTKTVLCN